MGYDTDRFVSPINDALTCCICRDVLEDPVQSPCEHAYCRTCIDAWLVHETTCPEDRLPLAYSSLRPLFRYMKNDLNKLQIKCRNHTYGCDTIIGLEFLQSHENSCRHTRLKCPNERCTYFATRQDIAIHETVCEFGRKECPNGCGMMLLVSSDVNHNCIQELKTGLEVLRSEFACKYEEQKHEMQLRLDMQRNHMIQKESLLQSQIDALKSENSKLDQNVKLLLNMEFERRKDIEKLKLENKELVELLRSSSRFEDQTTSNRRRLQRSQTFKGKESTI